MVPLRVKPQWLPTGGTLGRRAGIANLISSFDLTILQHKKSTQKEHSITGIVITTIACDCGSNNARNTFTFRTVEMRQSRVFLAI